MSNELRLSACWDCPGDELSPHKWGVLRFYNDTREVTRTVGLKEFEGLLGARPTFLRQIFRTAWQPLLDAQMVSGEEDQAELLQMIDRALTFICADTSKSKHTRRTMLQVMHHSDVVVKTQETEWEPKKVPYSPDL